MQTHLYMFYQPNSGCKGLRWPGGCFTNVSQVLQDILSKLVYCRNRTSYESFKLKLCACGQSHTLGTRTKFQHEILTVNVISGIMYFRETLVKQPQALWFTLMEWLFARWPGHCRARWYWWSIPTGCWPWRDSGARLGERRCARWGEETHSLSHMKECHGN